MSSSVPDPADPAEVTPEPLKDYLRGEHEVWFGGPRDDDIVVYPSTNGDYATISVGDELEGRVVSGSETLADWLRDQYDYLGHDRPTVDVRADLAAKRAILDLHRLVKFTDVSLGIGDADACFLCHGHLDEPDDWTDADGEWTYPLVPGEWPCRTVRLLAAPFRGAPGWRNEWEV